MKVITLLSLLVLAGFSSVYAQTKNPPKKRQIVLVYRNNPKIPVECEVFKISPKDETIRLGKIFGSKYEVEVNCIEGERYKFRPTSSNYRESEQWCKNLADTIKFMSQNEWASLWNNTLLIPKIENAPKEYYAIAALSSDELLSSSNNTEALYAYRNAALAKFYKVESVNSQEVPKLISDLKFNLSINSSLSPSSLAFQNYADSALVNNYIGGEYTDFFLGVKTMRAQHDYANAIYYFNKSISDGNADYLVYFNRSLAFQFLGDQKQATMDRQKAFDLMKSQNISLDLVLFSDLLLKK